MQSHAARRLNRAANRTTLPNADGKPPTRKPMRHPAWVELMELTGRSPNPQNWGNCGDWMGEGDGSDSSDPHARRLFRAALAQGLLWPALVDEGGCDVSDTED